MNQKQKEVQQMFLNNEKLVLKQIENSYKEALEEVDDKLALLLGRDDADMQNVIYQIEYQKALKSQIQTILENLHNNEFQTVSEYLANSYEDGFIGTMYDLQGQGIPLVIPIDQEQVVKAIQHETKLSEDLYTVLGKDTKELSKQVAHEISRGISSSSTYNEIARNIENLASIPKNNAARIARTEAHRIQCQATADAQMKAKQKGADIVKQWDSTLDGNTRPVHRELDGQTRELEKPFEAGGYKVMQPGGFGDPSQDCNCRCALLQRARWALGNDFTKWDKESGGIVKIKAEDYDDFKKKYTESIIIENSKADLIFKDAPNSKMTDKERFESTMEISKAYSELPIKVKQAFSDVTFEEGHDGDSCDIKNRKINVSIGTSKEEIHHEYGHLIEYYMMNKDDVDSYKASLTKGMTCANIKSEIYKDNAGNHFTIYVLSGGEFESEYQTRLYVNDPMDALNKDGTINTDFMLETISEPFRKYMNGQSISPEAKKLIESAIL